MGKCIVIVLDGLGIGTLPDVEEVRPDDKGANTLLHILRENPDMSIPHLKDLGILGALHFEKGLPYREPGCYSRIHFQHYGADTFYGHQEIMGSRPKVPAKESFQKRRQQIMDSLQGQGFRVGLAGEGRPVIAVNDCMTVADNIECDPGTAVNITGSLDLTDFESIKKVGRIVRGIVKVSRVIAFGGNEVSFEDILAAREEKGGYVGINAPRSGVYEKNYHCVHMGYGIDPDQQAPAALKKRGIPTYLLGKAADIIFNPLGESHSMVPTREVLDTTFFLF